MKSIFFIVTLLLTMNSHAGDSYGEKQGSDTYHGTSQNNSKGKVYESRKDKPRPEPTYTKPNCTYDSPCCGKMVDGAMNWAYPRCPR